LSLHKTGCANNMYHGGEQPKRTPFSRKEMTPVSLTLLHSMSDMPLYRAAEQLGVSTSYLKSTCRRLGISRWPRAGRSTGAVVPAIKQSQVDINYSRRLLRKYAESPDAARIGNNDVQVLSFQTAFSHFNGRSFQAPRLDQDFNSISRFGSPDGLHENQGPYTSTPDAVKMQSDQLVLTVDDSPPPPTLSISDAANDYRPLQQAATQPVSDCGLRFLAEEEDDDQEGLALPWPSDSVCGSATGASDDAYYDAAAAGASDALLQASLDAILFGSTAAGAADEDSDPAGPADGAAETRPGPFAASLSQDAFWRPAGRPSEALNCT
jgi:hypothetical protein